LDLKRKETTGQYKKEHTHELQSLYSLQNMVTDTKSTRIRRPRHVACMADNRNAYKILEVNREG
jgi:hypothetical protein